MCHECVKLKFKKWIRKTKEEIKNKTGGNMKDNAIVSADNTSIDKKGGKVYK